MEIQSVIHKIRLMCNRTVANGATEAEAMQAAAKVGEWLEVYNLSLDAIFLGEQKCVDTAVESHQKRRHPIDFSVVAIARFCDCKVWFSKGREDRPSTYHFFGLETDTEMAKYLYGMIFNAINTETEKFKQSAIYKNAMAARKTLSVSFQKGMVNRISDRLNDMTDKREPEYASENVTGTNIVLLKQNKVQEEFDNLGVKLGKATVSQTKSNAASYYKGAEAGGRVSLNRPIGNKMAGLLA